MTAETLETSRTRFPRFGLLLTHPRNFFGELAGATGGRFFHSLSFVCVLLATGAVLGYYANGAGALEQYEATTKALQTAKESSARGNSRSTARKSGSKPPRPRRQCRRI